MGHGHFLNSTGRHDQFLNSTGRQKAFLKSTCKIKTPPPPVKGPKGGALNYIVLSILRNGPVVLLNFKNCYLTIPKTVILSPKKKRSGR